MPSKSSWALILHAQPNLGPILLIPTKYWPRDISQTVPWISVLCSPIWLSRAKGNDHIFFYVPCRIWAEQSTANKCFYHNEWVNRTKEPVLTHSFWHTSILATRTENVTSTHANCIDDALKYVLICVLFSRSEWQTQVFLHFITMLYCSPLSCMLNRLPMEETCTKWMSVGFNNDQRSKNLTQFILSSSSLGRYPFQHSYSQLGHKHVCAPWRQKEQVRKAQMAKRGALEDKDVTCSDCLFPKRERGGLLMLQ